MVSMRGLAKLLLLVVLCSLHLPEGVAVQVISLQEDGIANLESQALYKGPVDINWRIDKFTFCGRIKIFFLHGRGTYFQFRNDDEDKESMLKGEIWLDRVRPVIHYRWQFQLLPKKLRALKWYHLCFTYDQSKTLYETYLDGVKVYDLVYDVERPVYGNFARVGQSGELYESFSGQVSQVNVWDSILPVSDIEEMAACKSDKQGNFITWDKGWEPQKARSFEIPLEEFCTDSSGPILFGFPDVTNLNAYYICPSLGTFLPLPKTHSEAKKFGKLIDNTFKNGSGCLTRLWSSLYDGIQEGNWLRLEDKTEVTQIPWEEGEPNGIQYENCGFVRKTGIYDGNCKNNFRCAVCQFEGYPILRMIGNCERQLQNIHYVVYQPELGKLLFRGYSDYRIEMIDERWVWYNRRNNQTMAKMIVPELSVPHYPMGRRVWELESTVCNQQSGERTLLLTHCDDDEFTCDDAKCIPLMFRCDQKYDCLDNSDETNCDIVLYPDSYKKSLTPRSEDEDFKSLPVMLDAIIKSIDVNTMQTTMTLAFEFKQTWYDNRLQYVNLKDDQSLNRVSFKLMNELWSPDVAFVNTPDNRNSLLDDEAKMTISKMSDATGRKDSVAEEMILYPGTNNTITLSRLYSIVFVCDFDLVLYPFDDQVCDMRMRITSASADYLYFAYLNSTIEYLGKKLLIEYEIDKLTVIEGDQTSFSEILFRVHMIRQYGFAVLTIYTPSLILLAISYVTLFFMPGIFEVRVMGALTALLVVATIFTQASGSLPKTSYFKFVDIWLLFCIGIIFLIIVFHTLIDIQLHKVPDNIYPTKTKVVPLHDESVPTSQGFFSKFHKERDERSYLRKLILASKITVFGIFCLFNLIYWGSIFF